MKAIILSAFVLLASMMPVDAVAQQSATTNFGVDRVLDGVKLKIGVGSLFVGANNNIFAGTSNYLYRSSDSGTTWVHLMNGLENKLPFNDVYAISATANGTMFLGSGADLFMSTDAGNSWQDIVLPNSSEPAAIALAARDSTVFVGTFFGKSIYRSHNCGSNWTQVFSTAGGFNAIMITPKGTVLAGTGNADPQGYTEGIYRSTDNGNSWSHADSGLIGEIGKIGDGTVDSNGNMVATGYNIQGLSCDSSTGVVYAATNGEGIFRSTDDGQIWTQVIGKTPMPMYASAVLAVGGKVWAAFHNDIGTGIAGDGGLYYSSDSGATWQDVDFIGKNVSCLYPYGKDSVLVGTDDGVYVVSSTTVTAVDEPTHNPNFTLSQNYPNPFNPSTTIRYSVQKRSLVTLSIYNVLGQSVKTLVNDVKAPGVYEASFDGASLPSGTYFYRLTAGDYSQTKKMVLLK